MPLPGVPAPHPRSAWLIAKWTSTLSPSKRGEGKFFANSMCFAGVEDGGNALSPSTYLRGSHIYFVGRRKLTTLSGTFDVLFQFSERGTAICLLADTPEVRLGLQTCMIEVLPMGR